MNIYEKILRYKKTLFLIWLVSLFYGILSGYNYFVKGVGFMPNQPVVFSHKVHSGDFGIKCLYCHHTAEFSPVSSIPVTKTCIVCHLALKSETDLMKPVNFSYDENIPLRWRRVFRLPDYVRFDHSRHIRVMIDCASCHGEIEKMDTVYRSKALSMKWCLDCHRNPKKFVIPARSISGIYINNLNFVSNTFSPVLPEYGRIESDYPKQIIKGIPEPKPFNKGPENCTSCHY
jgi:hypothetical protein